MTSLKLDDLTEHAIQHLTKIDLETAVAFAQGYTYHPDLFHSWQYAPTGYKSPWRPGIGGSIYLLMNTGHALDIRVRGTVIEVYEGGAMLTSGFGDQKDELFAKAWLLLQKRKKE